MQEKTRMPTACVVISMHYWHVYNIDLTTDTSAVLKFAHKAKLYQYSGQCQLSLINTFRVFVTDESIFLICIEHCEINAKQYILLVSWRQNMIFFSSSWMSRLTVHFCSIKKLNHLVLFVACYLFIWEFPSLGHFLN